MTADSGGNLPGRVEGWRRGYRAWSRCCGGPRLPGAARVFRRRLDSIGGTAAADHRSVNVRMIPRRAVRLYVSSLIEVVRCHLRAAGAASAALHEVLETRLTDPRKPRGIRHSLGSLVSVLVAGGWRDRQHASPLAIAGFAGSGRAARSRDSEEPGDRVLMSRRARPRGADRRPAGR